MNRTIPLIYFLCLVGPLLMHESHSTTRAPRRLQPASVVAAISSSADDDGRNRYEDAELEEGFADLDRDGSQSISLDEWRRPFEEHTDSWLQIADTVRNDHHFASAVPVKRTIFVYGVRLKRTPETD